MQDSPLITPERLAELIPHPDLRICDVRWYLTEPARGVDEYHAGHLPGAIFLDLDSDLSSLPGPGRHPLPTPAAFAATLGRLGIGPHHAVVAYDDAGGSIAARLWWMLWSIRHQRAWVLDGGIGAWVASGADLSTETTIHAPTTYPEPEGWTGVVGLDDLRARLGTVTVVDARAPERYRGDTEPVDPRAGHIPTAVSLPFGTNLAGNGRMHPPAALRTAYQDIGLGPDSVVYCGSGVNACHHVLGAVSAGIEPPLLYPGSWSDWSSHPDTPVAVGDEPGGP